MSKSVTSVKKSRVNEKITFTGTMHTLDFEVMYRIKLVRICKEYSQHETAFLLGKHQTYVSIKERFGARQGYTVEDINVLASLLSFDALSFLPTNPTKSQNNIYIGTELRRAGKIYHEARIKSKSGRSSKLLFKLYETDLDIINFSNREKEQLKELEAFVNALYDAGYFSEGKTPFEIFSRCRRLMRSYIRPSLVEQTIKYFIQLKRIKKKLENGYAIYINTEPKTTKPA